jgi:hypothetical protein
MCKMRAVLSDDELLSYSREHVLYEIRMLVQSAELLKRRVDTPSGPMLPPFWNAALESFAIHLRNLVDFFYPTAIKLTDVVADDFFPNRTRPARFPRIPPSLVLARKRAHKQVSHLTTERFSGAHPNRSWNVSALLLRTWEVLSVFAVESAPTKLHEDVVAYIATVSQSAAQKPKVGD